MRRLSKFWCLLCMSALFFVIAQSGCVHYGYYQRQTSFPNEPYESIWVNSLNGSKLVTVHAVLATKEGSDFLFPDELATVRFSDGHEIKIKPRVVSTQLKTPVREKFPEEKGYQVAATSEENVWLVRKVEKVFHGVVIEAKDQRYDERSKAESLQLGKSYKAENPEDAYAKRQITYEFSFPSREMSFEIEAFKVALESTSYPPKNLKYIYKPGGIDMRVAP